MYGICPDCGEKLITKERGFIFKKIIYKCKKCGIKLKDTLKYY